MIRLEQLCVQYLEASIGHRNVLVALQNAARLKLDVLKVWNANHMYIDFLVFDWQIYDNVVTGLKFSLRTQKWHKTVIEWKNVMQTNLKIGLCISEPRHDKTNKVSAPSEDSDQPGHLRSLIRIFAVCMKKSSVLSYPLSAQQRL